jgi:uncharacterized protein (TIGR03435 family)
MCDLRGSAARYIITFACVIFFMAPLVFGQVAPPLSFEVASIKASQAITPAMITSGKLHVGMSVDAARVDLGYMSLAELIPIAFKVKPYQVSGPEWMKAQRFDILAKMPEGATREQVPEMLQALLNERFQLKIHRENREYAVYGLMVAKGGSKLKESTDSDPPSVDAATPGISIGTGGDEFRINAGRGGGAVIYSQRGTTKVSPGPDGQMRLEMSKVTMAAFAEMLTRLVDRPVIDMTDLKGNYQIALDLSMDTLFNVARSAGVGVPAVGGRGEPGRPVDASDPSSSSIFASVQQLGLRLEPRKTPFEFVVIDHVERMPSEN